MSRRVWKFEVPAGEVHGWKSTVTIPFGAEIVSVGTQGAKVCVWAVVDPDAPPVNRRLGYFGTGSEVPDEWEYVGTAHVLHERAMVGSVYLWHVFEEPR